MYEELTELQEHRSYVLEEADALKQSARSLLTSMDYKVSTPDLTQIEVIRAIMMDDSPHVLHEQRTHFVVPTRSSTTSTASCLASAATASTRSTRSARTASGCSTWPRCVTACSRTPYG